MGGMCYTFFDSGFEAFTCMPIINLQPQRKSLDAFCVLPNTTLGDQEPDEKVILLLRAHPFTQTSWIFNTIAMILVLIIVDLVFGQVFSIKAFFWVNALAVVGICAYAWYNFLLWYYTAGFVTNKRIIDLNYYGIEKRQVIQAPIAKISDITSKSSGYFRQIFNYGDVHVQTEGFLQNILFDNVPDPDQAVTIIESAASGEIS